MRRTISFGIVTITAITVFTPFLSFSDTTTRTCADGSQSHPATAAEAASANKGGIIVGQTQLCPEDAKLGINANVGEAKQYLKSLPRSGSASTDSNIDQLNDAYAVCAARFLKQYSASGDTVTILAAYRSPENDAAMCQNNPNCGALMNKPASQQTGNHQRGLAMDVRAGNQTQINQFAKNNPSLGVCFPFSLGGVTGTGRPDTVHLIPVGGPGSESGGVGCAGVQNTCGIGSNVPVQQSPSGQQQRLPQLLSNLGTLLAPPQPQQCPPGYMMMNGTCLPPQAAATQQTSNPYSYLSPPPPPPSTSSTGGTTGTTGTTGNTNTNTNSNGSTPVNLNTGGGTSIAGLIDGSSGSGQTGSQSSSSISAIDLINQIANPTTTDDGSPQTQTATGTPVALGSSLNNQVTLHGTPVAINSSWQSSTTYSLSPAASQTFVSQDLSQTPTNMPTLRPVNSTFAVLENIKQTLLQILVYLKPFGGTVPRTAISNSATAYME